MLCWLELPNFFWRNNVRVSYCGTDSLKCFFINLFVLTVPSDILGESFSSMAITRFPCTIIVTEIFITRSVTISLTLNVYKPMLWSQNKIFSACFSCGRKMHRSHIMSNDGRISSRFSPRSSHLQNVVQLQLSLNPAPFCSLGRDGPKAVW